MNELDKIFQEVIDNPWTEEDLLEWKRKEKIDKILEPIKLCLYCIVGMSPTIISLIILFWWAC